MRDGRHIDVLDERESLRAPFLGSVGLHGALLAAMFVSTWIAQRGEPFGDPNPTGGSIGVGVVTSIPIPNRAVARNPVANDTESQVPVAPPKPVEKVKAPPPDPKAVRIQDLKSKAAAQQAARQRYQTEPPKPNQVTSSTGPAVGSPIYSSVPGSGGVGVGQGTSLGTRFGAYGALIRQRIAEKWRTGDVDPRLRTAPVVVVVFDILRDGSVRNVSLMQRSGNPTLDYSAQRAVLEAAPFPPLPAGFERDSARVEINFELKR
jgi:protein TonB